MYADRTVLNPVMGELEKEFGLSGTQLGLMNSVFISLTLYYRFRPASSEIK